MIELINSYKIEYVESESDTVQGTYAEVKRKYGRDWHIREHGNGNGNWLITKNSKILINGENFKVQILEHYGQERMTKKLFKTFCNDVRSGKIDISRWGV